jgi:hypothetical protein
MKPVLGIALVLGLLMLAEGDVMIALLFAFAVWLAVGWRPKASANDHRALPGSMLCCDSVRCRSI